MGSVKQAEVLHLQVEAAAALPSCRVGALRMSW